MLHRIVADRYVLYTSTVGLAQLGIAISEKMDKIMDKVDNMIEGVEPQIEEDTYDVSAEYGAKDAGNEQFKESPDSLYIGAKIIKARPMTYLEFHGDMDREDQPGYRVEYPDGYVSWSPKDVFETAYRKITDKEMLIIVNN